MSGVLQALLSSGSSSNTTTVTWNASDKSANVTLSNGNLSASPTGAGGSVRGTTSHSSGKWYMEFTITTLGATLYVGVATATAALANVDLGVSDALSAGYKVQSTAALRANTGSTNTAATATTATHVIGMAVDVSAHKIWWALDNTWQGTGDPSTTGIDYISTAAVFPAAALFNSAKPTINSTFTYTAPSGYSAW